MLSTAVWRGLHRSDVVSASYHNTGRAFWSNSPFVLFLMEDLWFLFTETCAFPCMLFCCSLFALECSKVLEVPLLKPIPLQLCLVSQIHSEEIYKHIGDGITLHDQCTFCTTSSSPTDSATKEAQHKRCTTSKMHLVVGFLKQELHQWIQRTGNIPDFCLFVFLFVKRL